MYLRFIGENGSMGLVHGQIYRVKISSNIRHIIVVWDGGSCPYSSPRAFADNWI